MNYLKEKLTYTDDGRLLDSKGRAVMMEWERNIMKESAKLICSNGGRILNIGFGLGIIDSYIQSHKINSHWIVEAHPDVINKIAADGWLDKENVTVVPKKWQDALNMLPKFDGIYFDTWNDNSFKEMFVPYLPKLLKIGGIFSYWGDHSDIEKQKNLFERFGMRVNSKQIKLSNIPSQKEQGDLYWSPKFKTYTLLEVIKEKEVVIQKKLL